jgi:CRP-like cAMP-binding protein
MAGRYRSSRHDGFSGIERTASAGEYVVREGDEAGEMYIIRSGRVALTRNIQGKTITLEELGPGEFFGEMSLLESLPRVADAVALEDTRLIVVGVGALLMRIRRDPTFAIEMLHKLAGRVRRAQELFDNVVEGRSLDDLDR